MASDAAPSIGLDHVGIFGHDLHALSQHYERLGFNLTPVSQHARPASSDEPAGLRGTANRCAMFERGYLELLAVVDPALDTLGVPQALSRYEGLHIIAFDIDDVMSTRERLVAAGIDHTETRLERDVELPSGVGRVRFTQLKPNARAYPEGRVFMLRHETRELVWQPRYLTHPNTATRLAEVIVAVDDPTAAKERYQRYLGQPGHAHAGMLRYSLGQGTFFTLSTPGRLKGAFPEIDVPLLPMPAAMIIEVRDLDAAEDIIRSNGVSVRRQEHQLIVASRDAAGITLILRRPDATPRHGDMA